MPIRVPLQTVIVQRNGANFAPPLGKPFTFTADEVRDIDAVNPNAIRKPLNEEAPNAFPDAAEPPKTPVAAPAAPTKASVKTAKGAKDEEGL